MLGHGRLTPPVGAWFAFEQIPEALRRLGKGEIPGKAVAEL